MNYAAPGPGDQVDASMKMDRKPGEMSIRRWITSSGHGSPRNRPALAGGVRSSKGGECPRFILRLSPAERR